MRSWQQKQPLAARLTTGALGQHLCFASQVETRESDGSVQPQAEISSSAAQRGCPPERQALLDTNYGQAEAEGEGGEASHKTSVLESWQAQHW
mmetsp:Transcript_62475/g.167290  ORF Transcript_62475/g.167290 Transcript_62475/m.167290 type:complete len:93 (-) Transcript_62475:729-1007(-)